MVILPPSDGEIAGSFGDRAEQYDRARPDYPEAMIEAIIAASPGPNVLDVGIGTGIAARQFAAHGCTVLGVDVDDRMAQVARRHGIDVEVSRFEDWDPKSRTFDTIVSAQTWHWIDPAAGAAKAAAALRPDGRLALCWNVFQPPPEILALFAELPRGALPQPAPNLAARPMVEAHAELTAKVETGIRDTDAFTEPERWQYEWERTYTTAELVDQLPTAGGFNRLPPDLIEHLLAKAAKAIDARGGTITVQYTTVVVTAALKDEH
jgi:SAM-dependent methyltransferase